MAMLGSSSEKWRRAGGDPTGEAIDHTHPFQSNCQFWSDDILLRKHGYSIHSRPDKGFTLWIMGKEIMTQEEALSRLPTQETEVELTLQSESKAKGRKKGR